MKYQNKFVIITGASRGVGLMLTNYFLNNGAIVIGISKGSNREVNSKNYHHFSIDLSDHQAITNTFRYKIRRITKDIDILINNAAVMTSQHAMIMPAQNAIAMINVNLLGAFFVTREAAKLMRGGKYSRIINIGSMASKLEPIGDSIYAASKSALITISNTFAKELSALNVTCNTLCITAIDTDMLRSHNDTAKIKIKKIIDSLTIPRMATEEDIINVIDFFSLESSSYITAQTIYLGGIN